MDKTVSQRRIEALEGVISGIKCHPDDPFKDVAKIARECGAKLDEKGDIDDHIAKIVAAVSKPAKRK